MLPCKTRARCFHCQKTITCFRHGTSNCKRHLARKHPNFYNGKEYIKFNPLDEETLDDGDDDGGNYEPSINDETSQNEEEYTITEMQFVDCPESKKDALEKAGLSKQSNEMTRAVKRAHDQGAKEELDDSRESKAEQISMSVFKEIRKHFSKVSRCKTRVRCNYCTVYIDVSKDMATVCKKHLYRAHPSVYNGKNFGEYHPDEKQMIRERKAKKRQIQKMARDLRLTSDETWKHFLKLDGACRARCNYCHNVISYSEGSASNCKRHLYRKHALILLKEQSKDACVNVEDILYEEDLDAGAFVSSFNPSLPSTDDDSNVKEVQFVKNPYLSEPIRIEIQGTISPNDGQGDHDGNENGVDYQELSGGGTLEVIEQIIPDDPYLSDDGNSRADTDSNVQLVEYYSLQEPGEEVLELARSVKNSSCREIKGELVSYQKGSKVPVTKNVAGGNNQRSSLQNNSRSSMDGMKAFCNESKVGVRSTVFATNIALELESMNPRQKIIAEKLISDVLYHAKLGALTEHAMVVGRSAVFDYDHGFDRQF